MSISPNAYTTIYTAFMDILATIHMQAQVLYSTVYNTVHYKYNTHTTIHMQAQVLYSTVYNTVHYKYNTHTTIHTQAQVLYSTVYNTNIIPILQYTCKLKYCTVQFQCY